MRNAFLFCFASVLLTPALAQAAVWGYVDNAGEAHLADRKLDNRYQLFQRDNTLDAAAAAPSAPAAPAAHGKVAPVRIAARQVAPYRGLVAKVAQQYHLDPRLIHAIISVESGYQAKALSARGAVGLMQVLPQTGARFGVSQLSNPQENIKAGARYLKFLLGLFNGNLPLAIAAYNAGEGAVHKYSNRVPPYPETQTYVARVLASYQAANGTALEPAALAGSGAHRVHVELAADQS